MIQTAKLKLLTTGEQRIVLLRTMELCNRACDKASSVAFHEKNWNRVKLQKQCYYSIREEFGLSAQTTILVTRKVADSYRTDIELLKATNRMKCSSEQKRELKQHKFKKHGALSYDARCLSFKQGGITSIWTVDGRIDVPLILSGKYADFDLGKLKGEADLLYHKNEFYLAVSYRLDESPMSEVTDFIGVDLGRKNIASTSDGISYCGDACEQTRQHYKRLISTYSSVGTKSAMRHVRRLAGREASFKRNMNHNISKELVSEAKGTGRGVALEDLTYIPRQVTANKDTNDARCKWAFRQLRSFIEYKAKLSGVAVIFVNPVYSSQKCSACGHCEEGNRTSQSSFVCVECGHAENADVNAAKNIREKAMVAVNQPMVVRHATA